MNASLGRTLALIAWVLFIISICFQSLLQATIAQAESSPLVIHSCQLLLLFAAAAATHKWVYAPILEGRQEKIEGISKQLSESASKEAAIINNAVDVIGLIDTNSRFVSVNPASLSVLSYAPDEIIGKAMGDFILPEDLDSSLSATLGASKSIDKIVFENRWRRKDGTIINLLWSAHWSASDHGLFCVIHDITERKLAEQAVQESEERIRLILESLPIALFITNRVGLIELSNSTTEKLSAYSREELLGKPLQLLLPDLLKSTTLPDFEELAASLKTGSRESIIGKKNGESIPVELTMREIQVRGENKFIFAALDVTDRYELDKAKREFVAMISHDLRSPLNSILITLNILNDGKFGELSDKGKQFVQQAQDESKRLIALIKDLLDLETMESSSFTLHFERVSMLEVIHAAVNALKNSADLRNLGFELPGDDIECDADGARLIQVMVNLLSNAVKFAPTGSKIQITLSKTDSKLRVSVLDKGRGIPAEKQEKIFEKFAQIEKDDWRQKGGSGLGLAICKAIIDQHTGRIGVQSKEGEETVFWFELPISSSSH